MNAPARWLRAVPVLLLAGCQPALLDPRGPIGRAEKLILVNSMAIMLAIVVPTIIATIAFAWWFRAGNRRARYLPEWAFSGRIELVVWSIPVMVILLLGGVTWLSAHQLDPRRPIAADAKPIDIEVVSLDWKWLFIYPEQGLASVNQLVVPAGVPLHFRLTSASVMNSFFVPQLGSMIYTMNGMETELYLHADEPGTYAGRSAQFSGDGFS
ncbi:MAG TPA: ubiquinol oxidase subunit II, partial [Caldimonas sp.]